MERLQHGKNWQHEEMRARRNAEGHPTQARCLCGAPYRLIYAEGRTDHYACENGGRFHGRDNWTFDDTPEPTAHPCLAHNGKHMLFTCEFPGWGTGYAATLNNGRTLYIAPIGAGLYSGSFEREARPNGIYLHSRPCPIIDYFNSLT